MDPSLIQRIWIMMAAVAGAIMPMTFCTGTTQGRAVVRVLGGTLLAVFLAPALEKRFLMDADSEVRAALSFLVGCFGLNVAVIVQRVLDTSGEDFLNRLARRLVGRAEK